MAQRAGAPEIDTYEAVKHDLITFSYKPGERLVEEALSERYGVSRTPIREALRRLEQEQLVVARQGARYVPHFDVAEFEDIYRVRAAIERLAAEQACERASDEELASLRTIWKELLKDSSVEDDAQPHADARFHMRIAELSKNGFLIDSLARINDRIWIIRVVDFSTDTRVRAIGKEHNAIVAAIADRDAQRAGDFMQEHIGAAMTNVRELVSRALTEDLPQQLSTRPARPLAA